MGMLLTYGSANQKATFEILYQEEYVPIKSISGHHDGLGPAAIQESGITELLVTLILSFVFFTLVVVHRR